MKLNLIILLFLLRIYFPLLLDDQSIDVKEAIEPRGEKEEIEVFPPQIIRKRRKLEGRSFTVSGILHP